MIFLRSLELILTTSNFKILPKYYVVNGQELFNLFSSSDIFGNLAIVGVKIVPVFVNKIVNLILIIQKEFGHEVFYEIFPLFLEISLLKHVSAIISAAMLHFLTKGKYHKRKNKSFYVIVKLLICYICWFLNNLFILLDYLFLIFLNILSCFN